MSDKIKVVERSPVVEYPFGPVVVDDDRSLISHYRPVTRAEFDALAFELSEVKRLFFAILDEAAKED